MADLRMAILLRRRQVHTIPETADASICGHDIFEACNAEDFTARVSWTYKLAICIPWTHFDIHQLDAPFKITFSGGHADGKKDRIPVFGGLAC
jgi:hypothetical protein